ncbi:MAG: thiamine pyrophosphate-dependent enzyme [Nitratireductor sp.]
MRWSSILRETPRSRCASRKMSAAVQYDAPIKIFILNNQYMGMVRQRGGTAAWQPAVAFLFGGVRRTSSWPRPMAGLAFAARSRRA